MRDFLAEKLLVKVMNWAPEEISRERPLLQALASFKYNDYLQFSTGIRFIESLAQWLYQFSEPVERNIAYDFIKKHLIFISNEQMSYLVNIAFNDKVKPKIILKTAAMKGNNPYLIKQIINSEDYKNYLRKTLFIGLSDGSRIDQFRRSSNINNEQVSTTHEIGHEKIEDILKELKKDLGENQKFYSVILIDDFTASGMSYFRPAESKGKIWKFLDKIFNTESTDWKDWDRLIDKDNLEINILFYIATKSAMKSIQENIDNWKISLKIQNQILVDAIQVIDDSVKMHVLSDIKFIQLAKKYFDESIIDRHFKKGKCDDPHLGFNECCLPLVLNHNTPNNSLPLLWFPYDKQIRGLFPRITRHKE